MSAVDAFRVWAGHHVAWGSTLCEAPGCLRPAEVLADVNDAGAGIPLCVDDADTLLERELAVIDGPRPPLELPDPWELRRRQRGRPPRRLSEWEIADRSPEKWLAEKSGVDVDEPDWDIPF